MIASLVLLSCQTSQEEIDTIINAQSKSGSEAAEVYEESREKIDPTYRILYNLAYSYLEDSDYTSALAVVKEGEEKFPMYIRFDNLEAYIYKATGRIESYHNKLKEIIQKDPGNIEIRETLVKSLVNYRMKDEIIKEAKELLEREPSSEVALNALSLYIPFYKKLTQKESTFDEDDIKRVKDPFKVKSFDELFLSPLNKYFPEDQGVQDSESF